jgi:hypothetical protein
VAYLRIARIGKPDKPPLLGNGCVTRNNRVTVRSGVFMRSVPRLHKESICSFSSEAAAERCQTARTGVVGHGNRGRYIKPLASKVTEDSSLSVIMICKV